uniref:Uncharacterized mitochondrial protein AtMg00810-like n=1 Tax=Tanacetum cinerariifolium TaxID=118510 RepID=A0A6L2KQ35_TANCI|nr:uncharacterized mitochondrial protein AtMg00810-like [Tanacetum cinerariifolium]
MKARRTLLMALPNKDQLKFHSYKYAKLLMEAIEKRYGGNLESKKLKIQGEVIEQEDINLKLLRSLPSEWKTHALIWRNKADIETISLDELYNNLKIYEPKLTGSSSTSQNLLNVAFVSFNSTNSTSCTNEADNTAFGASTAHSQGNTVNSTSVDNISDVVICAFLISQANSPQLSREDLEQIDPDDLEEIDLHWEMAILTIRARRAPKNQENRGREYGRKTMPMENPTKHALIAQDGIEGYDWSYQAKEEHLTNYALMALTSLGSCFSLDSEIDSCSRTCIKAYATLKEQYDSLYSDYKKSQFNLVSYKAGLQYVEERLAHYNKNEVVFEEKINILNLEVKLRDNALVENTKKLEKAEKERDELKLTLEKFQNPSKSLNNLLENQVSDKVKTGLGYKAASPVVESVVNSSKMLKNRENVKSRSDKGYHVVLPPYTWNYIPPKPNLTFIDEQVESDSVDVVSNVASSDVKTVESKHESVNVKNKGVYNTIETKLVRKNSFSPPIIEDWNFDDESEVEFVTKVKVKTVRPSIEKIKFVMSARKPISNAFIRGHSQVIRPYNKYSAYKKTIFNKMVNTVRVKDTTDREREVETNVIFLIIKIMMVDLFPLEMVKAEFLAKENLMEKPDEGFFVGYYVVSKAMRVFNKKTGIVKETLSIRFLENAPNVKGNGPDCLFDIDSLTISMNYELVVAGKQTNGIPGTKDNIDACQAEKKKVPKQEYILIPIFITDLLISQGPKDSVVDARKKAIETKHINSTNSLNNVVLSVNTAGPSFANTASPSHINAVGTPASTNSFKEHPFERFSPFKNAFSLPHVSIVTLINDTGIFGNAYDDEAVEEEVDMNNVVSSYITPDSPVTKFLKDHPKDQGYTQEEGIDYDEAFDPVARIEAIRHKDDILLVQVYVDDIIFTSTKKELSTEFEKLMQDKFQMSSMGELSFFLGLQVQQKSDGIFISQEKYVVEILKKFDFTTVKKASTQIEPNKALVKDAMAEDVDVHLYRSMMGSLMYLIAFRPDITFAVCACQPKLGLWYPKDSPFDLEAYSDSDYVGASLDRKSITGESDGFEQIVDFLNANPIKYALTVRPTIYTSCIKQFWTSAKVKTVNDDVRLQALVDGKKRKHKPRRKQREATEVPHTEPQAGERVPTPSHDPLHSEQTKTNQAAEIEKLKIRVKRLKGKKRNHGLKRLYKVRLSARVESSKDEEGLGDQEDASKQGRIAEIDSNEDLFLIDETAQDQGRIKDQDLFRVHDLDGDEVFVNVTTGEDVEQDATVAKSVEAAKPKAKGVTIQEPSEFRTTSPQQPSQPSQATEKCKGIMVEPEKTLKKKDQIALDEEVARKLEAEMKAEIDVEERIEREKNEANRAIIKEWDDVQATIDADRQVNTFVDMNTENVEESLKKSQAKVTEGSSKRAGQELEQESAKKQKLAEQEQAKVPDDDTAELKRCLEIVLEDVAIKATPLSSKSPTIVDYKIYKKGKKSYFKSSGDELNICHHSSINRNITFSARHMNTLLVVGSPSIHARNNHNVKGSQLVKDLHADRLKMVKELDLLRESIKISKSSRNMLEEEAIRLRLLLEEYEAFSLKCRGCKDKEATKSSLCSQDDVLN